MVLGDLIAKYIGNSPALYVMAGLAILIVANLVLTIILAHKSNTDSIKFELLPDFIVPLSTYLIFLLITDALVAATKGSPTLYSTFLGLEIIAAASIALKYYKQIKDKLIKLGMPSDPAIDNIVDSEIDNLLVGSKGQIYQILDEYFKSRNITVSPQTQPSKEDDER